MVSAQGRRRQLSAAPQPTIGDEQASPRQQSQRRRTSLKDQRHLADAEHSAGLQPSHEELDLEDPLLFKHRYAHRDVTNDRMIYYEYRARRHEHVLMLSTLDIQSCIISFQAASPNQTVIQLTMHCWPHTFRRH